MKKELEAVNVKLVNRKDHWLFGRFAKNMWTTIVLPGYRRVFYPVSMSEKVAWGRTVTLKHELKHVEQADTLLKFKWLKWPSNLLFYFLYIFCLPAFFSYFRWRWEREAYMVSYHETRKDGRRLRGEASQKAWVEQRVHSLWNAYLWAWPKGWMRKWFYKQLQLS